MTKLLFIFCGWVSLLLGVIGIFLPILPTTPFVLLAAYCFSRGSDRLHRWLLGQKTLGPIIQDWEHSHVIRLRAKWTATILLTLMMSYPIIFKAIPIYLKGVMALVGVSVLTFIWSCPSIPPRKGERVEQKDAERIPAS